jgi:hypothetical protein
MGIDSPDEIYLQSSPAAATSTVFTALQEHPVGFLNTLKNSKINMVTHAGNDYYVRRSLTDLLRIQPEMDLTTSSR